MAEFIMVVGTSSNSGKTTTIIKVANILQDSGYKVAIVKHDPKDKARFDKEGKDSYKFSQTGAEVVVTSPNKTTYFSKGRYPYPIALADTLYLLMYP